jgi:asparagine synthase (glutamine-hydrolysing)
MGFIHGEVSRTEPPEQLRTSVVRMLAAVAHYPWAVSRIQEGASGDIRCALASQYGIDEVASGSERGPVALDGMELAADVRLHERAQLASLLDLRTTDARAASDAVLVELAYRRWGTGCATELRGDGAFALWDAKMDALMCWRDPVGARPLYYYWEPGERFVFSSDLQAIVAHPRIAPKLDLAYVKGWLDSAGRLVHPSRTFLSGVRKLPAGHFLVFDMGGLRLERYWHPDRFGARAYRDDGDYVEELRDLLTRAVRCRMPAAGDGVGSHLSGGLDSSSVAVLAARQRPAAAGPLRAFSWAPSWDDVPAVDGDERHLVEAAAKEGPIEVRYACLRPSDVLDVICRDVALRPLTTLHYELASSRDAAQIGLRTVLSGWGGDETVAYNGRGYFAALARRGRFSTIQRELRKRAQVQGGKLRGGWKSRVLMPLLPDALLTSLGWLQHPSPAIWPAELNPDFVRSLEEIDPLVTVPLRERSGVRATQLRLLEQGHLQYRMESWASHGASLGITYAFPLLDHRLVEFALSIPDRLYFRDGWKRWLYRTAMEGILPDEVRWNPNKSDDAMVQQYHRAKSGMLEDYRERLLDHVENPFVDVGVLLDATEGRRTTDGPLGDAAWMAFTKLLPG